MSNIELRPQLQQIVQPGARSSLLASRVTRRVEAKVFENLVVARGSLITRSAQLDVDRQLAKQVIDGIGEVTERALRRTADIADLAKLRPASDPIEAEKRAVLEQTALITMREVLLLSGSLMAERAYGPGGDSCCRS